MSEPTILVTGGYGCIGAEAVKWFVHNTSASIVVCSRHVSDQRTDRVFYDIDRSRLRFVKADVRQQNELLEILDRYRTTHVVHMAALQTQTAMQSRPWIADKSWRYPEHHRSDEVRKNTRRKIC